MKRTMTLLLTLAMLVTLSACAAPKFDATVESYGDTVKASDGTVLIEYSYDLPRLSAKGGATAQKIADTFNATMEQFMQDEKDSIAEMQEDAEGYYLLSSAVWTPYSDTATSEFYLTEKMLSVSTCASSYFGGAHPYSAYVTWNYDLGTGEFFTLDDLTDDAEAMTAAVAENILTQITETGMDEWYYDTYEDYVRTLEGAQVCFDALGMQVYFSDYLLGPHAAGIPQFSVPYGTIRPLLNEYGTKVLPEV